MGGHINNALAALVTCCYYLPWALSMRFPEVHLWYQQTGAADSHLKSKSGARAVGTHTVYSTSCGETDNFGQAARQGWTW